MSVKCFVRDLHSPQVLTWVTTLRHGDAASDGRMWKIVPVTKDFERVRLGSLSFPAYEDSHRLNGPVAMSGSRYFTPPDHPMDNPNHETCLDNELCGNCQDVDIKGCFGLGRRRHSLGYFEDIASCTHCLLCRLIVYALEIQMGCCASALTAAHSKSFCILTSLNATFPIGNRENRPFVLVVYLVDYHKRDLIGTGYICLISEDAPKVGKTGLFYGRRVRETEADFDLVRLWLKECNNHPSCYMERRDSIERGKNSDFILIDVHQSCVVQTSRGSRYIALSYVWPRSNSLCLSSSNVNRLKQPGALLDIKLRLHKVITDSMALVRELGETYLWVDALCIVQDDKQLKGDLINSMDDIYGSSYLTIIAACMEDAEYGLPGVQSKSRHIRQSMETLDGLRFVTALPDYKTAVGRTRWASRAWTLQEGVLSRRCLIFTGDQLYFRCTVDSRCEDVVAETSTLFQVHPAKPKFRSPDVDYLMNAEFSKSISSSKIFGEYALLVRQFTMRSLTFQSDVINAFSGIMNSLSCHFKNLGFLYGLPERDFDRAVLWYSTSAPIRRTVQRSALESFAFPSWSWAGWTSNADYEMDILKLEDSASLHSAVVWYTLRGGDLVQIESSFTSDRTPEPELSQGFLYSRVPLLQLDPTFLVFWATASIFHVGVEEVHVIELVSDFEQSVPCFTITDSSGDPCGILPSTDREWASRQRQYEAPQPCELLLLSLCQQSVADETRNRTGFYHSKYIIAGNTNKCLLNFMLVEYGEDGVAYRKGIGKIHADSVDELGSTRKIVVLG